jgi:agmatinase
VWTDDVIDLGDVFTIPHLLSDEMLSEPQFTAAHQALYGTDPAAERLPVSPLDMCERVLRIVYALNPELRPIVIGGDHSVGWPAFLAAHRHWELERGRRLGLLHFDAHTDLLSHRLGVRYCFATWAWHANELLQRDGRLVQVGIRASGRDKSHWEQSLNVRQYWADEASKRGPQDLALEIGNHFAALGVDALYVSNDIDGTDPQWAASTGTPEPDGLNPDLVSELTNELARRFPLVAGDLVEVAPPLAHEQPGHPERTLHTAGRYLADLVGP